MKMIVGPLLNFTEIRTFTSWHQGTGFARHRFMTLLFEQRKVSFTDALFYKNIVSDFPKIYEQAKTSPVSLDVKKLAESYWK